MVGIRRGAQSKNIYFVSQVFKSLFWQPIVFGKVFKRLNVAVRERRDLVYKLEQCFNAFATCVIVVHAATIIINYYIVFVISVL